MLKQGQREAGMSDEHEQASERAARRRQVGKLSHPAIKLKLLRELALTNASERELAEKYDCAPSSMHDFKVRNAEAINDIRGNAEDEFAGLWIAKKGNRIAEYENQINQIRERIEEGRLGKLGEDEASLLRVAQSALKGVAEEMGQLTARVAVQGDINASITYRVEGVNPEDVG